MCEEAYVDREALWSHHCCTDPRNPARGRVSTDVPHRSSDSGYGIGDRAGQRAAGLDRQKIV